MSARPYAPNSVSGELLNACYLWNPSCLRVLDLMLEEVVKQSNHFDIISSGHFIILCSPILFTQMVYTPEFWARRNC